MTLPEEYLFHMQRLLDKDEYQRFVESYQKKYWTGFRANTLKIGPRQLEKLLAPHTLSPVSWCPEGFYNLNDFQPGKSPFYHAGLFYIQEPSAMAPASILDVSPGMKALDLCAAPGGKSAHIAAKLAGKGILVSNDISASRCKALLKNMELMGATNCVVTNESPKRLTRTFSSYFDRILIDAPCSGEGMFRKDPDAAKAWRVHKTDACSPLQRDILFDAAKMLKVGGKLLYSTCTFSPKENERMIKEFLKQYGMFQLMEIDHKRFCVEKGRPQFADGWMDAEKTARIWPHLNDGEGHFIAVLQKMDGEEGLDRIYARPREIPGIEDFRQFCSEFLPNIEEPSGLALHGASLHRIPDGLPDMKGIRLVRGGFYWGDLKKKRFEPSQALAMGLKKKDARLSVDFSQDDQRALRYLKGETLEVDAPDGWHLVCLEGYPLGWGKVQNQRMKNKYLKSWLMK